MYSAANDSPKPALLVEKFKEEIVLTNDKELCSNLESDSEEVDHSRCTFKKQSNKHTMNKRTAPISIYTYKVNHPIFSLPA